MLKDENITSQLQWIINTLVRDTENSFEQKKSRKWDRIGKGFNCHQWLIDNTDTKKWNKKWDKMF